MGTKLNFDKQSYNHSIKNAVIAGKMASRTSGVATTAQLNYCKRLVGIVMRNNIEVDPEYEYVITTEPYDRQDASFRIGYLSNLLTKAGIPASSFSTYRFDAKGNVVDQTGKVVRRRDGGGKKPDKVVETINANQA